jgi:hypothetical protein
MFLFCDFRAQGVKKIFPDMSDMSEHLLTRKSLERLKELWQSA